MSNLIYFKKTLRVIKREKNKGSSRVGLIVIDYIK